MDEDEQISGLDSDLTAPTRKHHLPPLRPIREAPPVHLEALLEDSQQAQLQAMQGALGVMFQRLDQQAKMLEVQYSQSQAMTQEMLDTLRILQEAFGQIDEMTDKLARITAALMKLYQLDQEASQSSLF